MPLYEVVLEQRYNGQQCINRWNYVGSGTPAAVTPSFALLSAMGFLAVTTTFVTTTVAGKCQLMQNPQVTFVQATARAVYIDEDFYGNGFLSNTIGVNPAGGNPLSSFGAFGFRTNRVLQSIGRGYKRFVGVSEAMINDYSAFTPTEVLNMEATADAMSDTLTYDDEGSTLTFTPCVAQKEKYTTPSGREAYKYYATELLQAPHLAVGINWEIYDAMTTQNSRKVGRGS